MKECVHGDANLLMSGDVVGADDGRFFEGIATCLRYLYVSISDEHMDPNDYLPIGYSLSIRLDRVDHDECIFTMKDEQNNELTFNGDSGIVSATLAMTFAALAVKMATQSELSSIDVRMGKDNKYKWTKEVVTFQEVAMKKGWKIEAVDDSYKLQIASLIQQMSYPHLVSMMAELYKTVGKNNSDLKANLEALLDKYTKVKDDEVEKSRTVLVEELKQLLNDQYTTHKTDVGSDYSDFLQKLEELTNGQQQQTKIVEAIQKSVSNGKKSVQSLSAQLANANTLISDLVGNLANANGTIDEAFKRASDNLNTKNNSEFTSALNDLKTTIDTALQTEKDTLQETAKALNDSIENLNGDNGMLSRVIDGVDELSKVKSQIRGDIDRLTRGMNSATKNMSDILLNQFKESLNGLLSQMETPSNRDVLVEASGSQSQGVAMGFIQDVLLSGDVLLPPGIQANALWVAQSTPEPLLNGVIQELRDALVRGIIKPELLAKVQKNATAEGIDSGATEITTYVVATETDAEVERTYGSTSSTRIVFFATLLAANMLWLLSHRRVGQETLQPFDNGEDNWFWNGFYNLAFPGIKSFAAQVQPQRPDDIRVGSCEKKEEKRTAQA